MDLGLQGRTAVITGASTGIGKAIARGLAAECVNVVLLARSEEPLREAGAEIADESGVGVLALPTDVTSAEQVDAAAAAVAERFDAVHVLVCNAGNRMRRVDSQLTWADEDWWADVDTKTIGMLRVIRSFLPQLARDGTGRIVNVSGIAGLSVWEGAMTHGLNNSAMNHVAGYLAAELADAAITVNVVIPGLIATEWRYGWADDAASRQGKTRDEFLADYCREQGILAGRWGEMSEVADAVVFLASDRARYINCARLTIDGGFDANLRSPRDALSRAG